MLKVAVVGIGRMGRGHVDVYKKLEAGGFPIQLCALCDVDAQKLTGEKVYEFNLADKTNVAQDKPDFNRYAKYSDITELLEKEKPDVVDIVAPTYLHAALSIQAMEAGAHVICEKPMAISVELCAQMIETSKRTGKRLMIGQCLHFWREYMILKDYVRSKTFGEATAAYFYRGGVQDPVGNPSFEQWILKREKGGGGLFDQHLHDIDMISWLFGTPEAVTTIGKTTYPESAYDICSTNYIYPDNKIVNAQDDTTFTGQYGFKYGYRVTFEHGVMVFEGGVLTIYPENAEKIVVEEIGRAHV